MGCNISDMDFSNLKVEEIEADVTIPFGSAAYTMRELIEDVSDANLELEEDPNTFELRMIYREYAEYLFTPDIIDIPDNSSPSQILLPNTNGPATVNQTIPFFQFYEAADDEVLDSVYHAPTSSIVVNITSTSAYDITYEMRILGTTDRNTDVPVTFNGVVNSGSPTNHNQNLTGYKTVFEEIAGQNRFDLEMDISANLGAGEDLNGDELTVSVTYQDQDFIVIFGKLGQDTVDISGGNFDISFFEDFGDEGLEFGGATITFNARNSFGIPIGLGLGRVYGEQADGTQTFLTGAVVTNPPVIASASTDHPVTGEPVQSTIVVNRQNSSLMQMLATAPTTIGLDLQGFMNPYSTTALNFATDTSSIRADIEVNLPLEVRMTNVTRSLDFDIGSGFDFDQADSVALRVVTTNSFPFRANMGLYIMSGTDTLHQVLDNEALGQPFLNIDRSVREPKVTVDDVPLSRAGLDALATADRIMVVIVMNTPQSQTAEDIFVKLLANAELEVTLGARAIIKTGL